jgi:hypothetical protein
MKNCVVAPSEARGQGWSGPLRSTGLPTCAWSPCIVTTPTNFLGHYKLTARFVWQSCISNVDTLARSHPRARHASASVAVVVAAAAAAFVDPPAAVAAVKLLGDRAVAAEVAKVAASGPGGHLH